MTMKRIISATNTSGISAVPAVEDAMGPMENDMKRVVCSKDSISKDLAVQIIKKASQALHAVLNLPDDIDGLDIYEYFDRSDFDAMSDVQETLMWTYLNIEGE